MRCVLLSLPDIRDIHFEYYGCLFFSSGKMKYMLHGWSLSVCKFMQIGKSFTSVGCLTAVFMVFTPTVHKK